MDEKEPPIGERQDKLDSTVPAEWRNGTSADSGGSMNTVALGRLSRVNLREAWSKEDTNFTPWLSEPENLEVLSSALGLDLEPVGNEVAVGAFKADIVCKDAGAEPDSLVVIENQIERTNHSHLGQVLTYASGLGAASIVWVASEFTEEHRSALDWLNGITDNQIRFFGVEVELWEIDGSRPAPKFNIVSKPNDWTRHVKQAARGSDDASESKLDLMRREYWAHLQHVLKEKRGPVVRDTEPWGKPYLGFGVGRTHVSVRATTDVWRKTVGADLYIGGDAARFIYCRLVEQREQIDDEWITSFSDKLVWDERQDAKHSRIGVTTSADPEDQADWVNQHDWLAQRLNHLHRIFSQRVQKIGLPPAEGNTSGALVT